MFIKFHNLREDRDEKGFTLIELLVVILIIAILAAIAIPVFLNQRKKGWASQVESTVKNAATAQESYSTGNQGAYTSALTGVGSLEEEGLRYSTNDVTLTVNVVGSTGYCFKGVSVHDTSIVRWYSNETGRPVDTIPSPAGACTGPAA